MSILRNANVAVSNLGVEGHIFHTGHWFRSCHNLGKGSHDHKDGVDSLSEF